MTLDVYTAVGVVNILKGGSTLPPIMEVVDDKGEPQELHVVKVFKPSNIEQYQPTNKEFYAYTLAEEFDLLRPKAALIYVDDSIIQDLQKREIYANFGLKAGYYYGCEYLSNAVSYEVSKLGSFETWELARIFAFDVLIRNMDRRVNKPNILLYEQDFHLIDHELSLNIPSDKEGTFYLDPKRSQVFCTGDRRHIFYPHLKAANKKEGIEFAEFREYLKHLDVSLLSTIAKQLKEQDTEDVVYIINYLNCIKQNENQFINLLKQLLV